MDVFEIHKYDRMPKAAPKPPALPAFDTLFKRPAPRVRKPSALTAFWRTWLNDRN